MDARCTPGGIFNDHLKDQVTDFFGKSLTTAHWFSGLAQHSPVELESGAVPADNGLGHDEQERLFPLRPEFTLFTKEYGPAQLPLVATDSNGAADVARSPLRTRN